MRSNQLRSIPGVGSETEKELRLLGYNTVDSLIGENPEEIFARNCKRLNKKIDRCQLYVFRLAVYYAEHENIDSKKLKWWDFKDKRSE